MANVTIYLPDDVEGRVRAAAKAEGLSVSRWIAGRVTEAVAGSPAPEFLRIAGAFPDFPDVDDLRRGYGMDTPREALK